MRAMKRRLGVFARGTAGAATVEAVFGVIILQMFLMGFFMWWSAYSAYSLVDRTTYTVNDLVTRQRGTVMDRSLLDGLDRTAEFILDPDQDAAIRFTQVTLVAAATEDDPAVLRIDWSYSPCGALPVAEIGPGFTAADLPMMAEGATMIVTDMEVPFDSRFVLVPSIDFERRAVSLYRFEQSFALDGVGASDCPG